ncbi:MAG: lysine--tRNA ligase, partial [Limnochordia bacterium]
MAEEHNEHQLPLEELMKIRRAKLEDLYKQGINPYGERFERTHLAREIIDHFDQLAETETRIAGRIMSFRT